MFNNSKFGKTIHQLLPNNRHIVADAGYTQMKHVMTLYPIDITLDSTRPTYNYLHSRTRITVEGAIGILKGRFQVFQTPLTQRPHYQSGVNISAQTASAQLMQA
jgi:hypothetical protein